VSKLLDITMIPSNIRRENEDNIINLVLSFLIIQVTCLFDIISTVAPCLYLNIGF
jgi:hypothetical protein